jgi:hypothetical protein
MDTYCPECGAVWEDGRTCQDYFHQLLYWENEDPARGEVHHLMVLCYHLQHPSLYSAAGLRYARQLLADFVAGLSPEEARRRNRDAVNSGRRDWSIIARPDDQGAYERPIAWMMTVGDVVRGGISNYSVTIHRWARSIAELLNEPG